MLVAHTLVLAALDVSVETSFYHTTARKGWGNGSVWMLTGRDKRKGEGYFAFVFLLCVCVWEG